ncbi:MAG: hypothetical protein FWD17_14235 [Polyangiaceae bacterium]|nr:hypothetical protein [Polyangiaceae bacterium]
MRVRTFADTNFFGVHTSYYGGGDYPEVAAGWDNQTDSLRVENNSRAENCSDLQPGEYAVFRNTDYADDCMVLHYANIYDTAPAMGIQNDHVFSVLGGPATTCANGQPTEVIFWANSSPLGGPSFSMLSGQSYQNLPAVLGFSGISGAQGTCAE